MKVSFRFSFISLFALVCSVFTVAQTPSAPPVQPSTSKASLAPAKPAVGGTISGHIADPSGAMIAGARASIVTTSGAVAAQATTDPSGVFSVFGIAPGRYSVKIAADGFAPSTSPLFKLAPGQIKNLDLTLTVLTAQQSVTVSGDDAPTVSVEADMNASSIVLSGKDLESLSDDPDELSDELSALAGPAAGPNGGQVFIDGFSGGTLPPKSAIREIRINQNPYSAEFQHIGYGRIEILTKPGTDKLHGRFFMQGNDDLFNTGNPFTKAVPSYYNIQFNGSIGGSLGQHASFFASGQQRNNQSASIYSANIAVYDPDSKQYVAGVAAGSLFTSSTYTEIAPRIDLQLGEKNTLTARYQFARSGRNGGIGSQQLPSLSSTGDSSEHVLQLSDSIVVNSHIVNETRFQYIRNTSDSMPRSTAPTVTVSGVFSGGGASGQHSHVHTDEMEVQNMTLMTAGTHSIKFGTRLRWNREALFTQSNFNGSFTFSSLDSYMTMRNSLLAGKSWTQIAADGGLPTKLTYTTGPNDFAASVFDSALYFQDDWKKNKFLTLSGGLRWESQNRIPDHSDFGPRVAFAYALDGHKDQQTSKTVLRGGYGFFYDRFALGNVLNPKRYSGGANSQTQHTITNPTCFDAESLSNIASAENLPSVCGTSTAKTTVQLASRYHSPYSGQLSFSLERQVGKASSITVTGLRTYGVHAMATRNANAYLPGTFAYGDATKTGTRPDPSLGIVQQYTSEAIYKQNQMIVSFNTRAAQRFNASGYYSLSTARTNAGTASNSWNLKQDYRRASWTPRHSVFLRASYTGPYRLVFDPFLIAQSGRPYNYVSPYDLTGDNFFNNRPALVDASTCASASSSTTTRYVQTAKGCFDMIPTADEAIIPADMGNGPASVAFNLRLSRAFGFGPELELPGSQTNSANAQQATLSGTATGGKSSMNNARRGFSRSGLRTNRKYTLIFSAQALNLCNNINYGQPVGTVSSSRFGQSTSLAGGIYSSGSAARRIFFQAIFSF